MDPNYNEEDLTDHQGVAAVIKNSKGEILIQEHNKYGFWTIPVGKAKLNQNTIEALKKELQEEGNIKVEKCKEIAIREHDYNRNKRKVKVTVHLFEILKYSGEIKNNEPEKHKQQIFMSIEKIKALPYLSDNTLLFLETLGIKRKAKIT